ncbi:hypothetical protein niasHS_007780 [Heterodera schachtii]|uniref:Uncharacterized protein n=1 Tax=Heterodera schachtii TaxID=97005 RepID=A0ABD2JPN8_HETSC
MLFYPISVSLILFTFFAGSAEAQNDAGVLGPVEETAGQIGRNLSCSAIHAAVRAIITAHPDWHQWFYEARQNQSDHIETCANTESGDVHDYLSEQVEMLRCPESRSRLMTVSIVFIIAFLITLAVAITLGILLYRKK